MFCNVLKIKDFWNVLCSGVFQCFIFTVDRHKINGVNKEMDVSIRFTWYFLHSLLQKLSKRVTFYVFEVGDVGTVKREHGRSSLDFCSFINNNKTFALFP